MKRTRVLMMALCALGAGVVFAQAVTIPPGTYRGANYIVIKIIPGGKIERWNTKADLFDEVEEFPKTDFVSGTYRMLNDNGLDFLDITWSGGAREKMLPLMVGSHDLLLYNADAEPYFTTLVGFMSWWTFPSIQKNWITASSSLKEGKTVFSTDKMGLKIGECWVEGVAGPGIGETLTLSVTQSSGPVYISSGFVSFQKPNLYRENSRIKKLRVYGETGKSKIVELRDTPYFQTIEINDLSEVGSYGGTIRMEILEVYPGTKYQDTCVNAICYVMSQ